MYSVKAAAGQIVERKEQGEWKSWSRSEAYRIVFVNCESKTVISAGFLRNCPKELLCHSALKWDEIRKQTICARNRKKVSHGGQGRKAVSALYVPTLEGCFCTRRLFTPCKLKHWDLTQPAPPLQCNWSHCHLCLHTLNDIYTHWLIALISSTPYLSDFISLNYLSLFTKSTLYNR